MKDHVLEKEFQIPRPEEEAGVDMFCPLPCFVFDAPTALVEDNASKRRAVFSAPKSPTYSAHSPKYAPQSPLYQP